MTTSPTHPNVATLRAVYANLRCIGDHVCDDVVLHAAERELPGMKARYVGRADVAAKELALIQVTNDTLVMDVQDIQANEHFGAVTGVLRAHLHGRDMAMPFCGLWRFKGGLIAEHWENAYDAAAFGRFLMGDTVDVA